MVTKAQTETTVEETVTEETTETTTQGVRARRAFTLKNFVPSIDWIMKEVVGKGKGTKVIVGRVYGNVTSYTDKVNDIQGVPTASIALNGSFETDNYLDGEISRCVSVFLPMAYSEALKAAFVADPELKLAEIDLDIGLEATGKSIPYEWVVIAHIEGKEMNALKRLRNSRPRPAFALTAPQAQLKLAAPAKD